MKYDKMNKLVKAKWLKALRSGKYRQSREFLRGKYGYCCIGVLECVMGNKVGIGTQSTRLVPNTGLTQRALEKLVGLNDKAKYSFKEIANWISKNL